ncbi:MAG: GGDEF domain-containing protein [Flexilinea sp.]|nr:GGDEF domain-containing protein [Flexilinea sp.]
MKENKNNIGKSNTVIILLAVIIAIAILLFFQYIFLNRLNRQHAYKTGEVMAEQVGNLLLSNDRKQQVLIETLKENYISKAKAVAYFLENNPDMETDQPTLAHIAELMSIDEIHLFNEEGVIYFGTVPRYYGYSFDSGDQMGYFKPMLSDKTLSMCQDVTPNTAESKLMMYAICWNSDGRFMVQVGIEPPRLIEELHANEISEVVDGLPVNAGMYIIVADSETGEILGSTLSDYTGKLLSESGIPVRTPEDKETVNYKSVLKDERVYSSVGKADKYIILVLQSVREINKDIPLLMMIVFLYLLLASVLLIYFVKRLTARIFREKRNASIDALTGLQNRRAYEDEIIHLDEMPKEERENLNCIMIDLNELKLINDRHGHEAGDRAIKAFAKIIDKLFSPYGKVYRIGGDEFAAFLFMSVSQLVQLIEDVESEVTAWSGENNISLSMSYGAVSAEEYPDMPIEELEKIADERMYHAKTLFYQKSGHDRRLSTKNQVKLVR